MIVLKSARVPWGLLGFLVLICLGEVATREFEPGLIGIEPWDWRLTSQAAVSAEVKSASVLCLGDSLIKLGVQPQILADRLGGGRRVYNLAVCAGRAPTSYFLLRRALAAGSKPTALIVDFDETVLAQAPDQTTRLYAELLQSQEVCELAATMRRPDFAGAVLTSAVSQVARNRFEIRQAILDALTGRRDPTQAGARSTRSAAMMAHWRDNRGAQVTPEASVTLSSNPADWGWVHPYGWRPDPTNAAYVAAFLDLARNHQIQVFWLLPPLHPGLTARQIEVGMHAPFDAWLAATIARFPEVTVVDGRRLGYDASRFIDMAHLDGVGATRLSRVLGSLLADRLAHAGPQVVMLAPNPVQQVSFETSSTLR